MLYSVNVNHFTSSVYSHVRHVSFIRAQFVCACHLVSLVYINNLVNLVLIISLFTCAKCLIHTRTMCVRVSFSQFTYINNLVNLVLIISLFTCATCLIHTRTMCVRVSFSQFTYINNLVNLVLIISLFTCATCLIHMCDIVSCICATLLKERCHSFVSFICAATLTVSFICATPFTVSIIRAALLTEELWIEIIAK